MNLAAESDPCVCGHQRLSHVFDAKHCLAMDCHCPEFRRVEDVAAQTDLPVEE